MSTSKSKHRECNSPVRVLDSPIDEQTVGITEPISPDNAVQLEFLKFLKTLDDVPQAMSNASRIDSAAIETQLAMIDLKPTLLEIPQDVNDLIVHEPIVVQPVRKPPLQVLLGHNFTHKLYLAASSEQVRFIKWSADGKHLQLDYIGLQEHLTGGQCMFRTRSILQFTRQLINVGFERALQEQEQEHDDRPQLYYYHANFKRFDVEQLLLMPMPRSERLAAPKMQTRSRNAFLPRGGPKEPDRSAYTPLQLARFRFQTLLNYHNDVRLLQEREPNAEQLLPRRGRISSSRQTAQSILAPALASKHMNPRDSVLEFEAGKVPDYAGFYGSVEPSLITEFFAEYLPRYGASTSGYKDIVVDASRSNAFQQNLPIGVVFSEDEDDLVEHNRLEPITPSAVDEHDHAQASESFPPPPEDIELEQVMQELCGIGGEQLDADPEKKEVTPHKPKLKRKKLARKCAIPDVDVKQESNTDDHIEDLLQAAAAAEAYIKEEPKSSVKDEDALSCGSNNEADKELKCQPAPKTGSKRRRYDLRNSKSKRPR